MNGIGGCTIAEAKQRLCYSEFLTWCQYRNKRGSLNPGTRIEFGAALLAALYSNKNSKHGGNTVYDFTPHHDAPRGDDRGITLEQAMKEWA
jgi:hypothetical protein